MAFAHLDGAERRETFAIGKDGKLVWETDLKDINDADPAKAENALATSELLNALEDQLGLPKTPRPKFDRLPTPSQPPVSGGSPDCHGRGGRTRGETGCGRKVSSLFPMRGKPVKTDLTGAFSITVGLISSDIPIKIEAPGLATRTFWASYRAEGEAQNPEGATEWVIEFAGRIDRPLRMRPGVVVTGRVVRGGKPIPAPQ